MRGPVQIDVVTPAANYDLIDLPTLKTLLNLTDDSLDAYLDLVIPQASAKAAEYCNQPFVVEAIQTSFWPTRDGWPWVARGDIAPLQLPRWPLISVTSVVETIDGVATALVAGTDYMVDLAKGQLTRLDSNGYPRHWAPNPTVVNFSAGYALVPADVVAAVADVIKGMLYARQRDPNLRSENIEGVYQAAFRVGAGADGAGGLPASITGPLDKYRMPVIA